MRWSIVALAAVFACKKAAPVSVLSAEAEPAVRSGGMRCAWEDGLVRRYAVETVRPVPGVPAETMMIRQESTLTVLASGEPGVVRWETDSSEIVGMEVSMLPPPVQRFWSAAEEIGAALPPPEIKVVMGNAVGLVNADEMLAPLEGLVDSTFGDLIAESGMAPEEAQQMRRLLAGMFSRPMLEQSAVRSIAPLLAAVCKDLPSGEPLLYDTQMPHPMNPSVMVPLHGSFLAEAPDAEGRIRMRWSQQPDAEVLEEMAAELLAQVPVPEGAVAPPLDIDIQIEMLGDYAISVADGWPDEGTFVQTLVIRSGEQVANRGYNYAYTRIAD